MKKYTFIKEDLSRRLLLGKNWLMTDRWILHITHLSPASRLKMGYSPTGWDLDIASLAAPQAAIEQDAAMDALSKLRAEEMYWDSNWRLAKGSTTGYMYTNAEKTVTKWLPERYAKFLGKECWGHREGTWVSNHNDCHTAVFATLNWEDER